MPLDIQLLQVLGSYHYHPHHRFHLPFIHRDRKGELQCPNCGDIFNTTEINRDNYSRKHLEKMVVYCLNKENGCSDEMKLKDLDVHLEGCLFQLIECLHKAQGCTAVVIRGQLADHLQYECQFRLATCEFCGVEFPVMDLKVNRLINETPRMELT